MRFRLRGVNKVTKKSGLVVYYYHRRTGTRLRGEPDSLEFLRSYAEAEDKRRVRVGETLSGLIRDFEGSAKWRSLRATTQNEYRRIMKAIEAEYGSVPYAGLETRTFRKDVLEWRDKMAEKAPREADNRVTVLARLLAWGADRDR